MGGKGGKDGGQGGEGGKGGQGQRLDFKSKSNEVLQQNTDISTISRNETRRSLPVRCKRRPRGREESTCTNNFIIKN